VILQHRDGIMASVTVVKDHRNEIHPKINNRFQMGGTSSVFSDRREGHIPLLLHSGPRKVLFLGMGTGGTLAAAADSSGLEAKGVELVAEVIPLLRHFERATGNLNRLPRLDTVVADARRYVNCSREKYDVVVADLFHPARDGSGALYTHEHFQAIKARLDHGGVFCQWVPLFQLDLDTLCVIVRTFLQVFPDGSAFLAHYSLKAPIVALVSGMQAGGYPSDW
jgi:spermidine synthase